MICPLKKKKPPKLPQLAKRTLRGPTNSGTESTSAAANAKPETVTTPSSGSTDESITAFVERTLTAMTTDHIAQDAEVQETSTEPPSSSGGPVEKVSVSDPLTLVTASNSEQSDTKANQDIVPGGKKTTL